MICLSTSISHDTLETLRSLTIISGVSPIGCPGVTHLGIGTIVSAKYWPLYKPQQEGDSRCSYPALNALASYGIISRSGRGIKFTELTQQIRTTYNFSPSFCSWVPHIAARMLGRNYKEDTFDLEELDLHNGIEHDASLTRLDTALQPKQWIKHDAFIQELLSFATGKDADGKALLTIHDTSRILVRVKPNDLN
ncbi:Chloroperoxidase [Tylopilus felleus]